MTNKQNTKFVMKKIILLAAAIVAMAGCTKQLENKASSSKEISFSTPVIAPSTKAIINGTTYASTDGSFGVYSVWSPEELVTWDDAANKVFMNNVEVSYAANIHNALGGWKPANAYFWPNTGKLSFYAYRPYAATGSSVANGYLKFTNFVVDMTTEPVDLLYSSRVVDKTANAEVNNYYGVDIPFHHALSQITFNAKTKADYTTGTATDVNNVVIKLTSVKLTAKNTSTGTQSSDAVIGWATATNEQQSREIVKTAGGIELSENLLDASAVTAGFNELLAMPQDFTSDNDVVLDIEYTVNFTALDDDTSNATEVATDVATKTKQVVLNTLTFSDGQKAFTHNKKYIFNIIIGLDEVSFAPQVVDWVATPVTADVAVN